MEFMLLSSNFQFHFPFQLSHSTLNSWHSECEQRDEIETIFYFFFFDTSYRLRSFTVMRLQAPRAQQVKSKKDVANSGRNCKINLICTRAIEISVCASASPV